MKAFAYIRVSGKGQCDGDGPERQREKIAEFCKKNSIEFLTGYFEEGVSGTVEALDRPAFVNMLAETDRLGGAGIIIVVERMDRLARDLMVQELLLSECRKRGIKVFATDQGLVDQSNDEGNPSQTLIRQIMGAIAQWEKSVIVAKLRCARDRKRRDTGRCEGAKRYGELPGEKEVIDYGIELFRKGHSFGQIADSLNLSGYKTRTGKNWNKARLFHIFPKTFPKE